MLVVDSPSKCQRCCGWQPEKIDSLDEDEKRCCCCCCCFGADAACEDEEDLVADLLPCAAGRSVCLRFRDDEEEEEEEEEEEDA